MKNYLIFTLSFFVTIVAFAQKHPGTIYFKNGEKKEGYIKVIENDILFRVKKREKRKVYTYKEIDSTVFFHKKKYRKYHYIKVKGIKNPILAYLKIDGSVKLYKTIRYFDTSTVSEKILNSSRDKRYNSRFEKKSQRRTATFYLKKSSEDEAIFYANFHPETPSVFSTNENDFVKNKKFDTIVLNYFSDCDSLIKMFNQKKYKKKHYLKIVEFYNKKCK